mmetsp:Transcript_67835/g.220837  ORF Transcript_67835/g.220837 Transcript_67835/m.220837 type:complete len:232 (-) Transcript_67835:2660-3355(-)
MACRGHRHTLPCLHQLLLGHQRGVQVSQHLAPVVEAAAPQLDRVPEVRHLRGGRHGRLHEALHDGVLVGVQLLMCQVFQFLDHQLCEHGLNGLFHIVRAQGRPLHDGGQVVDIRQVSVPGLDDIAELPGSAQLVVGDHSQDAPQEPQQHLALNGADAVEERNHRHVVGIVLARVLYPDLHRPRDSDDGHVLANLAPLVRVRHVWRQIQALRHVVYDVLSRVLGQVAHGQGR